MDFESNVVYREPNNARMLCKFVEEVPKDVHDLRA